MAHFAKVLNDRVVQVIVAEPEVIASGAFGAPEIWVQTSYNTRMNQHPNGTPLRGNFAREGYIYDSERDAFYSPAPYPSWTLDETTFGWKAPIEYPNDGGVYKWDEENQSWVAYTME
jgi:hypothetical protein